MNNSNEKSASIQESIPGILHEISTPLSIVSNISDALKADLKEDILGKEEIIERVSMISEAIDRVSFVTNSFKTIIQNKNRVYNKLSINTILDSTLNFINLSGIKVIKTIDSTYNITAEKGKIDQVLLNIIKNAKEALLEKKHINPTLEINLTAENNTVKLTISDNGIGMDEETSKNIYQPFFTTKNEENGEGIGMTIVHSILEQHNAKIILTSKLGVGTTFSLIFPKR